MKQLVIALAALVALPAAAETRLQYVDEKTGEVASEMLVADGKVRMDNEGAETWTLFDAGKNTLIIVNPTKKTYSVLDEEALDRMSGQVNDAMKEMRKQLEQMPEEQRKMMEKMMGGAMDMGKSMVEMKVDRTGKTMTKGGYDCRQVFLSVGKLARQELCVVDQDRVDISDDDRETLDEMQAHLRQFAEKMSQGLGMNIVADYDTIGGMPVYMKQDSERSGKVLKNVAHDVDASKLRIPEGYREEELGAE